MIKIKAFLSKEAKEGWRLNIQKFGSFMAGMIMPVIGVIIAWGLWTAMFLYNSPTSHGWFQVPSLGRLVGPGIKYLIPILIATCAGRMVYGVRGSMIAAFVILTAIVGTEWIYEHFSSEIAINGKSLKGKDPNQIVTAMILGPLSAYVLKKIESLYLNKIKSGFEMLVKNFGLAFFAIIIGIAVFFSWGWILFGITYIMTSIVNLFGTNKWVAPFLTIFTEPIRTVFLNNALNHGVMVPIGFSDVAAQASEGVANPASLFFMFGGNAGPGLGLLLAFTIWKKGKERASAGGASIIQIFGGIHEVYYVFVLRMPIMLLATIPGAATSMGIISYLGGGTSATVSPGSIISVIAMSPTSYHIAINVLAVLSGALVTFLIASLIIKRQKNRTGVENVDSMNVSFHDEGMSFKNSKITKLKGTFDFSKAKKLVVACDAGVGSSAMAAGIIKKYIKKNNINLEVSNCALKDLNKDVDIVVTMKSFEKLAKERVPDGFIFTVNQFLGSGIYDELYKKLEVLKK